MKTSTAAAIATNSIIAALLIACTSTSRNQSGPPQGESAPPPGQSGATSTSSDQSSPPSDLAASAAAPTRTASTISPAPDLIPQQADNWCWAASAEMIMAHLGTDVSQCDQAAYRLNQPTCCNSSPLEICNKGQWPKFNHWGFNPTPVPGALPLDELESEFANGRYVGFVWDWAGTNQGSHMMVATGVTTAFNAPYIQVNDPDPVDKGDTWLMTYDYYVAGNDHTHDRDYKVEPMEATP